MVIAKMKEDAAHKVNHDIHAALKEIHTVLVKKINVLIAVQ